MPWFFKYSRGCYEILLKRSPATSSTMSNPIVRVRGGKLRGAVKKLLDGSQYYSFNGIPYAEPPVGKLRFKAPVPVKPWNGTLDALKSGPMCPQQKYFSRKIVESSENCLFLNVHTRSLQPHSKIPVIFYIHGGAFLTGSGNIDIRGPEFLLQHDVILVTINYRLEAFGFLCLDIPEVPGNAGLKDQVTALRWVKNNINEFGGDPENITIFGDSAGGVSVTYHMISPMSKGLFHKAISQSGTFLSDWTLQKNSRERAFNVGKYLGKETNDPYVLLNFLQSIPSSQLIALSENVRTANENNQGMTTLFTPVVEKEFPGSEAFLTEKPLDLLLLGKIQKVPLIAGFSSAEGLLFVRNEMTTLEAKNKFPLYFVEQQLVNRVTREKLEEFARRIMNFYFKNKELTQDDLEPISIFLSDKHFIYGVHRFVNFYAEFSESIYMYRWNLVTELNFIKKIIGLQNQKGACHGDNEFYFFKNGINTQAYEEQQKIKDYINTVTKLWTDFAKTGNPTPDDNCKLKWRPYTKSNQEYLRIDEIFSMGKDDEKERLEFFDKLFIDAGLPPISKSKL